MTYDIYHIFNKNFMSNKLKNNKVLQEILKQTGLKKPDELFNDDLKCLEFMSNLKWVNGFKCKKCDHDNYCKGKLPFSRRCTRCKNEESAIANTIFHHSKFPLSKAMYIAFEVSINEDNISSYELANKLELRQMTCWKFKDKILKKILARKRLIQHADFCEILLEK